MVDAKIAIFVIFAMERVASITGGGFYGRDRNVRGAMGRAAVSQGMMRPKI